MTPILLTMAVLSQAGVSPIGPHDRTRVGKKSGYAIDESKDLVVTIKGPRRIALKLFGSGDLHGRSIWLDIERNDEFISENTLALVERGRGPKNLRAQADLEMSVPPGKHNYRLRSSDKLVVVFARAGRGGALVVAKETPLSAGTERDKAPPDSDSGFSDDGFDDGEPAGSEDLDFAEDTEPTGEGKEPKEPKPREAPEEPKEPKPRAAPETPRVASESVGGAGYEDGFYVRTSDGRFALVHNGRIQVRHSFVRAGDSTQTSAFNVPRAYVVLGGRLFDGLVRFRTEVNAGEGVALLKDAYADVEIAESLFLRVGQWRRPFSRQQITPSHNLQLVDRALTNDTFDVGRDIGLAIHNDYESSPGFEWVFALVNGASVATSTGASPSANVGISAPPVAPYGVVARAGYNSAGLNGYDEPDFQGGPLRFGVAASGMWQLAFDGSNASAIGAELDFIVKASGLSTSGAFYLATAQTGAGALDQGLAAMGFHLQAGFLLSGWVEPMARFAMHLPEGPNNNFQEITAGVSFYILEHNLKAQTDFSFLVAEGVGIGDSIMRSRLQLQMAY